MPNEKVIKIINIFEKLLASKNIKIPNKNRENNIDEAFIYGDDYYNLETEILKILNSEE